MMSTVTPVVTDPPAAARAGADLREARERLGLSLHDVAFTLRIRLPHLEALEEGQISLLPGNAYALAFVRTYANALGLDAEEMVRRFRTEAAEFNRRTELVFPVPMPERGIPAGAVLLLGLVLAVGAYAGWYHLSGEGRLPAETVAAIPQRLAPLAQQALPPDNPAAATTAAASAPGQAPPKIVLADPAAPAMMAPPVMPISPTSAAAAQVSPEPSDDAATAGLSPMPPAPPAADANRIVLRATADAWMQVKDHSGAVLLNKTLKAGDSWPVPPRTDLLLTTGNAGGTDIEVDGAPTPSLGGSGAVRRDIPLDPDQIKDGKLAATAPQLASTHPHP
ncbi:helix-turn-helix domain-containing protein [Acidisphaera sp. S103]|uniref:helix-turn-helix domain-containing protein n=1 Tax=Acidisphaera sp. S103 TaxID=1747223 RepID=UPI00131DA332|nr:helix-turn-helix domain-containing protein [Acidisphaera sp. S103]